MRENDNDDDDDGVIVVSGMEVKFIVKRSGLFYRFLLYHIVTILWPSFQLDFSLLLKCIQHITC